METLFDSNLIDGAAYEVSDAGAFYSGRRWDQRGNVVRNNTFRTVRTRVPVMSWPPGGSVQAIYLDDEMSGYEVVNNTFEDVQRGVFIGGGRRNRVVGNTFTRTDTAIHLDDRGAGCFNWTCFPNCPGGFCSHAADIWRWIEGPSAWPLDAPPWSVRYPTLANLRQEWPGLPVFNELLLNVYDENATFLDAGQIPVTTLTATYFTAMSGNRRK